MTADQLSDFLRERYAEELTWLTSIGFTVLHHYRGDEGWVLTNEDGVLWIQLPLDTQSPWVVTHQHFQLSAQNLNLRKAVLALAQHHHRLAAKLAASGSALYVLLATAPTAGEGSPEGS